MQDVATLLTDYPVPVKLDKMIKMPPGSKDENTLEYFVRYLPFGADFRVKRILPCVNSQNMRFAT